ncbi:type III secretion protein HrpV [Pseudomonas borbori]
MSLHDNGTTGKRAFQESVAAGMPAQWELAPGIEFCLRREPHSLGLALQVHSHVLQPNQLSRSLERRFEDPQLFDQYFLFIDPHRALVVWHALPERPIALEALSDIQSHELLLVGLEHLDDLSPTY